jgi:hypothetical protein
MLTFAPLARFATQNTRSAALLINRRDFKDVLERIHF